MLLAPLLAAMLAPAAPAAPAAARPHWRVDWGEPRCMLVREGSPADPAMVARFVPADRKREVWIIDPRWQANSFGTNPPVQLVLEPDGRAPIEHFNFLPVGKAGLRAVVVENAGEDFFERLAKARSLSLRKKGVEILSVPVPAAAAAVAAASKCEDDMLRQWGVDPVLWHSLKERPNPIHVESWLSYTDYPDSALRSLTTGVTVARVDVGADGKATDCTVVVGSGSADLDRATCGGALRGRFSPARTAEGKAVSAMTIFNVVWRILG
jgi:TonB family protein